MKMTLSFDEDERKQVERLVAAARQIFPIDRVHFPVLGKDDKLHMSLNTRKS